MTTPPAASTTPATPAWYTAAHDASARVATAGTLFVLGCQKSGTTWLQVLLNAHPWIACGGEGHFTSLLTPALQHAIKAHNDQAKAVIKVATPQFLALTRFAIEQLMATYLTDEQDPREPNGVRWIADKTPEAAVAMPLLDTLFPGSRYIHIIRDGRDGVVSGWAHLTRQNQAGQFPSVAHYAEYFAQHHWVPYITRARQAGSAMPGRYHEVRYEQLHADPAGETRRMLSFLGVSDDDASVERCVSAASFRTLAGGRAAGDADSTSHFRKGVVGDWRESLPADAVERFERVAGPVMGELGYERAGASARHAV